MIEGWRDVLLVGLGVVVGFGIGFRYWVWISGEVIMQRLAKAYPAAEAREIVRRIAAAK